MSAALLALLCIAMSEPDVQADADAKTQLYVKTTPPGASVLLDGKVLGKSDGLFDVAPGTHKLALQMEGYASDDRSIEAHQRQITRIEAVLRKPSGQEAELGYVEDSSDANAEFCRFGLCGGLPTPGGDAVDGRRKALCRAYGYTQPPKEDFHIYLLDQDQKVLKQIPVPYANVGTGRASLAHLHISGGGGAGEVLRCLVVQRRADQGRLRRHGHKRQGVAFPTSACRTRAFTKWTSATTGWSGRWSRPKTGKRPTYPKVTTYEDEKAADTESKEALPTRTWNDSTGALQRGAQLLDVEDGKSG